MARSSDSVWANTAKRKPTAPLEKSAEADVCIVGAGIAGMSAAYQLAHEGKSVIVLEKSALDFGETPRTSAHLSNVLDAKYKTIAQMHGEDGARKAAESHTAAISEIEAIAQREGIDCEFKRTSGYVFLAKGDSQATLKDEFDASRNAGLAVEWSSATPLRSLKFGILLRHLEHSQLRLCCLFNLCSNGFREQYLLVHVPPVLASWLGHGSPALSESDNLKRTPRKGKP